MLPQARIIDCYFGGTVSVAEAATAASGILGAAVSFNGVDASPMDR